MHQAGKLSLSYEAEVPNLSSINFLASVYTWFVTLGLRQL